MRATPLAITGCAVLIGLAITADVQAEAVKVTPELTVFTKEQPRSADGLPTVLRGSATKRGTVDGRFGAGTFAPVGGELIVCDERRIDCFRERSSHDVYE